VFPEDVPAVQEQLKRICRPTPVVNVEHRVQSVDGEIHWLQAVHRGIFDDSDELVEIQFVGRDICDRRRAEESLRRSEEQFRRMAETVEEVFWLTSPQAEPLYVSPAFRRVWGRSCAEVLEDRNLFLASLHPDHLPQLQHFFEELGRGHSASIEYRIERPDGSTCWISDRGYPKSDARGEVQYIARVASDITTRKESEERLKGYAQRLVDLEEELRKEISAELHDDVGQELTVLSLNLGHLGKHLDGVVGETLKATIDDSRRLVRAIHSTVRNLMVTLRPIQLDEYGLGPVLASYAELFGKRTGIAIQVQVSPEFPRLGPAAEIALFRITQEALHNVLKHAEASQVQVALEHSASLVRLEIADNGRGLRPAAPHPGAGASGWGLTIMRERAELVGGTFRVEAAPGRTSVIVELGPCGAQPPLCGAAPGSGTAA